MTSVLETRYDRTTTQLLRDALKRSHEDARSIGLGIGTIEDPCSSIADPQDRRPHSEDRVRVLDDRSRYDLAVASSDLYDLSGSLSALMRAGLVLSWVRGYRISPQANRDCRARVGTRGRLAAALYVIDQHRARCPRGCTRGD